MTHAAGPSNKGFQNGAGQQDADSPYYIFHHVKFRFSLPSGLPSSKKDTTATLDLHLITHTHSNCIFGAISVI